MDKSRTTQLLNELSAQEVSEPIPRSFILGLANEKALHLPPEQRSFITKAAKTVLVRNTAQTALSLKKSELGSEFMELPDGIEFLPGIPGKSEKRMDKEKLDSRSELYKGQSKTHIEGFIPETEQIIYNPIAVFAGRITQLSKKEKALRKKVESAQSSTSGNHITIFGGDNRINIYPSGFPERCVCWVEVYVQERRSGPWVYQKRGTGFMAGKRVMMTSGHMAPTGPYTGWMIKVIPGYYDGRSVYGPGFYTYVTDTVSWNSDSGNDMMACRLYDSIGTTTGYFGARSYSDSWEDWGVWSMCGYPFDRGSRYPTYQSGIPVRDDDDGDDIRLPDGAEFDTTQIENEADEASGASGSPLYSWFTDGHMYAIGVHHGTETDYVFPFSSETYSAAAGGDGLVGIIRWARSNWP